MQSPRRRRLLRIGFLSLAAAVGVGLAALGLNTIAHHRGWTVERLDPDALSAMLSPAYKVFRPGGDGPFPTALLFSGCDGPHDNMERWADALVADGWAAIIVDSHGPRGYDDYEAWRLVCVGQLMTGGERAGDVLVALADAREMAFVDRDRLALIGMSHGGWSIMDLLALDAENRLPLNLRSRPGDANDPPLSGVRAAVLVYPWCGPTNRAVDAGWDHPAPVLFVLADDDMIAPARDCRAVEQTLRDTGHDVEELSFSGVTHGFDQQHRTPLSNLRFDPEATTEAISTAIRFLNDAAMNSP
ncbi:dienelactone hydrolase family protein [Amorphus orientalis]|uniref:Dienelactone hydrolase n=1 Tax=Amorphus orientalis TaxID=649198 RepID=A0AAE3VQX2_9HYPH|nr:dienelactone hydrolase family protein [Amorphus orientalis]MDQ0316323.1 dienelactone hydrolase [Amorphus orientalis]